MIRLKFFRFQQGGAVRLTLNILQRACIGLAICAGYFSLYAQLNLAYASKSTSPLRVVTSIRPLALIVQDIAPVNVQVDTLVPAFADPHHFQLTTSMMQSLSEADVIVWLGEDFEQFLSKAVHRAKHARTIEALSLEGLEWPPQLSLAQDRANSDHDHHPHSDHQHQALSQDPHIWLNPANGAVLGEAVARILAELLPEHSAQIDERLQQWLIQVEAVQDHSAQALALYRRFAFGVSHNAYSHFVYAYGLHQQAAVAEVPNARLSAKKMAQLQHQLESSSCLIVEADTPQQQRLARTLALPLVMADPLASSPDIHTYLEFQETLTQAFIQCFTQPQP